MINNIIFDFGGVLYDIDYELTSLRLSELSTIDKYVMTLDEILDIPDLFEKGKVSECEFRSHLREMFGIFNEEDDTIDAAWNAMLLGIKKDAVDFINNIKNQFNIALLSNTNSIHYKYFHNETEQLENSFQFVYFSHIIGLRKPESEIYDYVCKMSGFKKEETLFIDDNLVNVNGAISANLKAFHCKRNGELSDLLNTIKNIAHTKVN